VVSTKVGLISKPDGTRGVDLTAAHIRRQLDQSTERLGRVISTSPMCRSRHADRGDRRRVRRGAGVGRDRGVNDAEVTRLDADRHDTISEIFA
jgi:hypothetical protein